MNKYDIRGEFWYPVRAVLWWMLNTDQTRNIQLLALHTSQSKTVFLGGNFTEQRRAILLQTNIVIQYIILAP